MITKLIFRVLKSRFGSTWLTNLSYADKLDIAVYTLAKLQTSLNAKSIFELVHNIYQRRRIKYFPVLESWNYARAYGFFRLMEDLQHIDGDVVEFGVGRGISLAYLTYAVAFFKLDKTVYGFDSFKGFAPAVAQDISVRVSKAGEAPSGWDDTSPELIREIFALDKRDAGSLLTVKPEQVVLVPGFFQDTISDKTLPAKIALLHVDCDMYEPTKLVLESCLPRMQPGGIVVFDEYGDEEKWPGERKAADEIAAIWKLDIHYNETIRRYCIKIPTNFTGKAL